MDTLSADVLVVGAGPVGLSLAGELRRHGVACRLIDQGEGPAPAVESRALAIWERTQEVFAALGVIDRVREQARVVHGMNAYAGGRRLLHVGFDLADVDSRSSCLLTLPQGQTQRILIERLGELGLEVEWRTRLTALSQDENGVTATLNGPEGRAESIRARWLVGCDGAHSAVRHALGLAFEGAGYEEKFLLADARVEWALPDDEAHLLLQPGGGALAAFPLPETGRWRLIDATGIETPHEPARVLTRFADLIRDGGISGATVSDLSWTSPFGLQRRLAERFRVNRAWLAGDSAHVHSPAGGQGMNTGIQDAANLAWKLALATRGRAREVLLDSYEAERRPVANQVLKGTDVMTRVVTLRGEVPRQVRDSLIGILGEFAFVRRRAAHSLSELDIAYRDSPVVGEDRSALLRALRPASGFAGLRRHLDFGAAPHPGDRAPDVALTGASDDRPFRLFDALAGTRHSLLLFPGSEGAPNPTAFEAIKALIHDRYSDLIKVWIVGGEGAEGVGRAEVLPDPDAALHHRFGAAASCLYLVRPDGYVGYRAQPPDAGKLQAYLERIIS